MVEISFANFNRSMKGPEAIPLGEFGAMFGKSYTWAWRLARAGKIRVISGYGTTLVPKDEILRLLNEAETK